MQRAKCRSPTLVRSLCWGKKTLRRYWGHSRYCNIRAMRTLAFRSAITSDALKANNCVNKPECFGLNTQHDIMTACRRLLSADTRVCIVPQTHRTTCQHSDSTTSSSYQNVHYCLIQFAQGRHWALQSISKGPKESLVEFLTAHIDCTFTCATFMHVCIIISTK